jgi:ketosteroid isomerase-like protein
VAQSNVDVVRAGYEHFLATGKPSAHIMAPGFAWDMSKFRGWPERQIYEGPAGAERFMDDWLSAWDDWQLDAEAFHEADDKVVAVMRQRARSKSTGMTVDMSFAQVWTIADGLITRMEMYADAEEALRAVGLSPGAA